MFLSLFLIFCLGGIGGLLFKKIKLPKLIWYLFLGIALGPSLGNVLDPQLLEISAYLRQIALVIILTRSGLSLDIKKLKAIGRPAILLCFVPACFEIIGVVIFAPMFLKISYVEALLLGSVLAAVSPAVVVPRMIRLKEEGYGNTVPELIMAGASCDDIFVIVLFYSFKGLAANQSLDVWSFAQIPTSILLGVVLGIIVGFILYQALKRVKIHVAVQIIILLGLSFGMLTLETSIKDFVKISALLAIIVMAIVLNCFIKNTAKEIKKGYDQLWQGFEILLFVLVGAVTDIHYAFSTEGAILVGILVLALGFRTIGVFVCLLGTSYTKKERGFVMISYLPKATVQASIGAIALNEGLACGPIVLTGAVLSIVLTAPIGAILMDYTYKKLLTPSDMIDGITKEDL